MRSAVEIIGWVILAAVVVLVIMNAQNVATVLQSGTSALVSESALLTGSGYNSATYGSVKAA